MRGDDNYRVGDFTSGTARAAGSYASDNRCRLAGAGVSSSCAHANDSFHLHSCLLDSHFSFAYLALNCRVRRWVWLQGLPFWALWDLWPEAWSVDRLPSRRWQPSLATQKRRNRPSRSLGLQQTMQMKMPRSINPTARLPICFRLIISIIFLLECNRPIRNKLGRVVLCSSSISSIIHPSKATTAQCLQLRIKLTTVATRGIDLVSSGIHEV